MEGGEEPRVLAAGRREHERRQFRGMCIVAASSCALLAAVCCLAWQVILHSKWYVSCMWRGVCSVRRGEREKE